MAKKSQNVPQMQGGTGGAPPGQSAPGGAPGAFGGPSMMPSSPPAGGFGPAMGASVAPPTRGKSTPGVPNYGALSQQQGNPQAIAAQMRGAAPPPRPMGR